MTMRSVTIKKTNKNSKERKREEKGGKQWRKEEKNLICFTHLELQGISLLLSSTNFKEAPSS
jgi:hypothetical protein